VNVPRFWASAREDASVAGRVLPLVAFGWSHESHAEAQAMARQRLARVVERVRRGEELPKGYAYGDRPVREEILRETPGEGGAPSALVTRNRYGALVLNTARALFIDVDVPQARGPGLVARIFGRAKPDPEAAILERVRTALRGAAGASFRIYRTAAGFRVLATDPPFEPDSARARELLAAAGADPHFVRLCEVQRCFRARLTPKPERLGLARPPATWPRETEAERSAFADWLRIYEAKSAHRAVCRLVDSAGFGRVHEEIAPLLAIHDGECRVGSDLPLA
jgi:hypothetical protein